MSTETAGEHDAHVRDFEFFTRSFAWVERLMEDEPSKPEPTPRRRKVSGFSPLRVDDVSRPE